MRSEKRRSGERFRDRLRISSWCLTSTDSADYGTRAARAGQAGDCHQQMQNKDSQIAHGAILTRSRNSENARDSAIRHPQDHFGLLRLRVRVTFFAA